ncbi:HD domain-containing protein, partial [Marinospirillum sp.]|uniref:HD domain-containing protein n=1 Tax=Marinospirillum sp. TaxID=2183934 RepID=UPI003A87F235
MSYFDYWGKAGEDTYHLLSYHCLDVAAVAWHLLDDSSRLLKDLADLLEMEPQALRGLLIFIIALHDLGKFPAAFQNLKSYPGSPLTQLNSQL